MIRYSTGVIDPELKEKPNNPLEQEETTGEGRKDDSNISGRDAATVVQIFLAFSPLFQLEFLPPTRHPVSLQFIHINNHYNFFLVFE
ncbi:hypothetical protein EUTSA_v10001840mg [Eutrema salsugineum]|uniref:Uncharacterized protein n=1 Tax=Eutrema salsugineum TaxID=72664 RepID=V4L5F3_EUTSA|nr:hypothetical protein EUTSA_v10001840mg [Eutrema salsugineum]